MKILSYKTKGYTSVYNPETEEVEQQECVTALVIECPTRAVYDAVFPDVERAAIPGTIEISGEFDPEPETPETGDVVTWAALNAAYQEGVDSV